MSRFVLIIAAVLSFVTCGGEPRTTSPDPPNAARGLYVHDFSRADVVLIVLPDGRFFVPFRTLTQYGSQISGVGVGRGTATADSFAGNYQYFGALDPHSGIIAASFTPRDSLTGTLLDAGNSMPIQGYALPSDKYNMDAAADPLDFSGYWIAGMLDCGLDLKVTRAGAVTGTHISTGTCTCDFDGTFSADSKSDFYSVQLNFPPSGCPLNGEAKGIALAYPNHTPPFDVAPRIAIVVSTASGNSSIITGIQDPSNLSKP